ncbi:MAG TPA: sulfur carrier protein ThiS [Nocardioidaceae bacterium]|nr:sulfur carrier protein ThiS [Nocardioidaceae bacterium]
MTIQVNGRPTDITEPITVQHLLQQLDLPRTDVAVAVDGAVVPRSSWQQTDVGPEAQVEVVTAMQGG